MSKALDNRNIIVDEIQAYAGHNYKLINGWYHLICPNPEHNDSRPSCCVYVGFSDNWRLGQFHCWSCSIRGSWNEFADLAGLKHIQEWKSKYSDNSDSYLDPSITASLLGSPMLHPTEIFRLLGCPEAQPWPDGINWRNFSYKVMQRSGAYIAADHYNNDIQAIFLVKYAGLYRGGVKALNKTLTSKSPSYINLSGQWLTQHGLLFYSIARKLIQRHDYDFVLLVEGPRDALRLLCNGIPAVANLGALTMSKAKALMLSNLGISKVYVIMTKGEQSFG
jgi:hypothetical protein